MVSAAELILEYICPLAGGCTAMTLFAAPIRDVYDATRVGHLGYLNATPWVFMLGNCYGWLLYAVITDNIILYSVNVLGLFIAVWLNLQAVKLRYVTHCQNEWSHSLQTIMEDEEASRDLFVARDQKSRENETSSETTTADEEAKYKGVKKANADAMSKAVWEMITKKTMTAKPPVAHENMLIGMIVGWIIVTSVICFAKALSHDTQQMMAGLITNLILVFFYAAPLSTIYTVLRTQSSATIHGPTVLMTTVNGTFWLVYGLALLDFFIAIPNGLGALLGLILMLLRIVFPTGKPLQTVVEKQEVSQTSATGTLELEDNQKTSDV